MSEETKINRDAEAWSITLTSEHAMVEADDVAVVAPMNTVAHKILNENTMQADWLPMAVRYMSNDRSVILVEKPPRVQELASGDHIYLPWTYFLFYDDSKVLVMFRPMTLLMENNPFSGYFLAQDYYPIADEVGGKFSQLGSIKRYVDLYIYAIYQRWQSAHGIFDLKGIDEWMAKEVKTLGDEFPSETLKQIEEGTHNRVEIAKTLFGIFPFTLEFPEVSAKVCEELGVDDPFEARFNTLPAKHCNTASVNNGSIYQLFVDAILEVQKTF